jgi:hypothetical protein
MNRLNGVQVSGVKGEESLTEAAEASNLVAGAYLVPEELWV